ncbi:MAG: abortive phage infection protein [Bacillota bacterium]|nr:abortive phage infection protein [Bacillota bacterium]
MIEKMLEENNGILKTADVIAAGISKEYFYQYVKKAGLEKAAHGVYVSPNILTDEMYLLQAQFPKAIYSHEAALYLHDLAEKEPMPFTVTVAASYNSGGLTKRGVKVYYVKKEWYSVGLCEMPSHGGHTVRVYDMERTICDIIRKRSEMDIAVFTYAVQQYARRKKKNIPTLMKYAGTMRIERQAREIMGVLL